MKPASYFWPLLLIGTGLISASCDNIALVGRESITSETRSEGAGRAEITGAVDRVDTRARELYVRTRAGRTTTVYYNPDTRVVIRGREHSVSSLRPDDEVTIQLLRNSRGNEVASIIRVRDRSLSTAERPRPEGTAAQTIEGTVERVDVERGYFEIRPRFGNGTTRVFLPYNPARTTEDQFRRLREGDYVRVDGEIVTDNRVELKSFL